ncbi:hypothetical protein F8M41_022100 [Gigaspora margarita]|uniref:Uncharacterized protein n=1 Tax=Gigaspora margarita TaxID=4874 RepID=A0A8H4AFM2_GIGMA|nr:hypothetical protein F8M41_022100 [Gigaspora margarita]
MDTVFYRTRYSDNLYNTTTNNLETSYPALGLVNTRLDVISCHLVKETDLLSVKQLLGFLGYCWLTLYIQGKNAVTERFTRHTASFRFFSHIKIKDEFTVEKWSELLRKRPNAVKKTYHQEIEPLITHLFEANLSLSKARSKCLDAFESFRNPVQNNCLERQWMGIMLFL